MKSICLAISAIAFAIALGQAEAAPLSVKQSPATAGSSLTQVQWEARYCRHLRDSCLFKHRLGEEGEGNCRRYHQECPGFNYNGGYGGGYGYGSGYGGGYNGYGYGERSGTAYEHRSYCRYLRHACIYREARGEVGEGNCRRYRERCAGE